jgi:hypothetical protein
MSGPGSKPPANNDKGFQNDLDKINSGYKMLDDIEKKLKGYLDHGISPSDSHPAIERKTPR